jgi:hypothetical protein
VHRLLPPRPFLGSLALRVALVWGFFRGVSMYGVALSEGPYPGSLGAAALVVIPVLIAVRVDMGRRSELIFLANLGHSFVGIATGIVAECLALEALLRLPFV